ncbi:MAG TPA: hypothetical protein VG474_07150, partial [Solirubrobacteraceae bacterium]|nr:hypothetical protein [Solirubrobacteraceae bacterium]
NYPIIADADFNVAKLYGMLPAGTSGDAKGRTPADNQTVRNVFVIGPDKKIKLILIYPMTTGRNFDEVLRVLDSLQLTAEHKVATPAQWQQGEDVIIAGSVSDDAAKEIWPEGWDALGPPGCGCGQLGCGTIRMYGRGASHSPKISRASSSGTEPAMMTFSPFLHWAGVATLWWAVSCSESMTRSTSSKLRPVVIG